MLANVSETSTREALRYIRGANELGVDGFSPQRRRFPDHVQKVCVSSVAAWYRFHAAPGFRNAHKLAHYSPLAATENREMPQFGGMMPQERPSVDSSAVQ